MLICVLQLSVSLLRLMKLLNLEKLTRIKYIFPQSTLIEFIRPIRTPNGLRKKSRRKLSLFLKARSPRAKESC